MALNISVLEKALASLDDAIAQPKNDFMRDAAIQRFEYTIELAWRGLLKNRWAALRQLRKQLFVRWRVRD